METKKFTFKKIIPTGRYSSFEPDFTEIKLDGCVVGNISQPSHFSKKVGYGISFAVKNDTLFKWVVLVKRFENEADARKFLNENFSLMNEKFDLYKFPKEN